MIRLSDAESNRLVEIAQEHIALAKQCSQSFMKLTSEEKAQIRQRINELRQERDAIIKRAQEGYGKKIARPHQVSNVKKILCVSQIMSARELTESCREYKLMHRIQNAK